MLENEPGSKKTPKIDTKSLEISLVAIKIDKFASKYNWGPLERVK